MRESTPAQRHVPTAAAPRVIGRFQCEERLGADGLFETWRARVQGLSGFDRMFAVKCLAPGALARRSNAAENLLRAGRAAAAVKDARLAAITDSGLAPGTAFVATEFVHGVPLAGLGEAIRGATAGERPATWAALIGVLGADIARALAVAHGAGPTLVHGSLVPANVMVTAQGAVKLLDFGLRVSVHTPAELAANPARRPYLAPELAGGENPSAAGDLHALGAMLAELAGGRAGEGVPPGLPAALTMALVAMLDPDPGRRPNADKAAQMLKDTLAGRQEADLRAELGAMVRKRLQAQPQEAARAENVVVETEAPAMPNSRDFTTDEPTRVLAMADDNQKEMLASLLKDLQDSRPGARPTPTMGTPIPAAAMAAPTPPQGLPAVGAAPTRTPPLGAPLPPARAAAPARATAPGPSTSARAPRPPVKGKAADGDSAIPGFAQLAEPSEPTLVPLPPELSAELVAMPPKAPAAAKEAPPVSLRVDKPEGAPVAEMAAISTAEVSAALATTGPVPSAPAVAPPSEPRSAMPGNFQEFGNEVVTAATAVDSEAARPPLPPRNSGSVPAVAPTDEPLARRPRKGVLVAVGLVLAAGAAAAVALSQRGKAAQPVTVVAPAKAAPRPTIEKIEKTPAPPAPEAPKAPEPAEPPTPTPATVAPTPPSEAKGPPPAEIEVVSEPPGASIWLGGKKAGATPKKVKVPAEAGELRLVRAGFQVKNVQLDGSTPARVEEKLAPTTAPPWGETVLTVECRTKGKYPVMVDGQEIGLLCPTGRLGLQPGTHEIAIIDPATGEKHTQSVELTTGTKKVKFGQ